MPGSFKNRRDAGPAEPHGTARTCGKKGCDADGGFRAPKGRDRLDEYFWFCLEHIREYNRAWDYFAGMNAGEIEEIRQNDTIWERPTWPWGGQTDGPGTDEARLQDAFERFRARTGSKTGTGRSRPGQPTPGHAQRRALDVFGLDLPVGLDRIKARYKELVKRHHPDANGGDRLAEERLKEINDAYRTLTNFVLS